MKLIDENGKLFGKINIVDFFIIFLVIVITPAFFHVHSVLGKMPATISPKLVRVKVVTFTIPEIAELFKEGDVSYGEGEDPDGKLIKVLKGNNAKGEKLKSVILEKTDDSRYEHRVPVFLELELACTQSSEGEMYYYRRVPLFMGLDGGFIFDTDKYRINCYTIEIKDPDEK